MRDTRSWDLAPDGTRWLSARGFSLAIAGRHLGDETDAIAREDSAHLFADQG